MEIDSSSQDKLEAYHLLFNRTRFAFVSKINTSDLKYFSIQNQQKLGKIDIRLNINALRRLRNNQNFNYFVMTEYQQVIPFIYLLRSQPQGCKILTTKIMLQCAKLYAEDFYHIIKKMNQVVSTPSYEEQSQVYDVYQLQFQIDFGAWVPIFKKQQIQLFFSKCIAINYGQVYDTDRGTLLTPYPSGVNVGSAVWLLQNPQTKNKLLWIQGLSHHNWRACQQFNIDPKHSQINNIVFTAGVLSRKSNTIGDQQECLQFLKKIMQRVNKGSNSRIVIQDFLVIPDIINYIAFQFKDKLKRMIFTGVSMNKIMSYINSYPEFLTTNHRKRIFEDPPVYPFETYDQMKQKTIVEGTIEEVSAQKKMPVKQFDLRSTPYIHFESDFHAFLIEGENEVVQAIFQKCYDLKKLDQFLSNRKVGKIICICKAQQNIKNIPDIGQPFSLNLLEQNIFVPDQSFWKYYMTQGQTPNLICKYQKINNVLKLKPIQRKFRQLKRNWHQKMKQQMLKYKIRTVKSGEDYFETDETRISIEDFKIKIESSSLEQLQIINWVISQNSRIFMLA